MSKVTLAETGWTEYVREALTEALERASKVAADMHMLAMCDGVGCGFTFDTRDPRHGAHKDIKTGHVYQFCPACEQSAQEKDRERMAKT